MHQGPAAGSLGSGLSSTNISCVTVWGLAKFGYYLLCVAAEAIF